MHYRIVLAFLILALMYLVVYLLKLTTGQNFYYVQILAYVLIVLVLWSGIEKYLRFNELLNIVFFFTLSYISVYMLMGLWTGFGLTPYSMTLHGIFINIVFTVLRGLSLELIRLHMVNYLRYRNRQLSLYLPAFTIWFLTWFPYPLITFTFDVDRLKTLFRYVVPSLMGNMYSTFLVLNSGFTASLVYNLLPQVFVKISPYLPNLDWLVEGALNTLTPLVGFYTVLPYTNLCRRHRRLIKAELKSIVKLIAYFTIVVLSSMVLQGRLGFRLYVISSRSMEPSLNVGDVVIVCSYCRNLVEGDIAAYVSEFGVIVHRVVGIDVGGRYLITKGDANLDVDPKPVFFENIIGKVVYSIPLIGYLSIYVQKALTSNLSPLLLVAILTAVSLYGFIRQYRWK